MTTDFDSVFSDSSDFKELLIIDPDEDVAGKLLKSVSRSKLKDKAAKDKAAKDKAEKEKIVKDKTEKEKLAKEKSDLKKAETEKEKPNKKKPEKEKEVTYVAEPQKNIIENVEPFSLAKEIREIRLEMLNEDKEQKILQNTQKTPKVESVKQRTPSRDRIIVKNDKIQKSDNSKQQPHSWDRSIDNINKTVENNKQRPKSQDRNSNVSNKILKADNVKLRNNDKQVKQLKWDKSADIFAANRAKESIMKKSETTKIDPIHKKFISPGCFVNKLRECQKNKTGVIKPKIESSVSSIPIRQRKSRESISNKSKESKEKLLSGKRTNMPMIYTSPKDISKTELFRGVTNPTTGKDVLAKKIEIEKSTNIIKTGKENDNIKPVNTILEASIQQENKQKIDHSKIEIIRDNTSYRLETNKKLNIKPNIEQVIENQINFVNNIEIVRDNNIYNLENETPDKKQSFTQTIFQRSKELTEIKNKINSEQHKNIPNKEKEINIKKEINIIRPNITKPKTPESVENIDNSIEIIKDTSEYNAASICKLNKSVSNTQKSENINPPIIIKPENSKTITKSIDERDLQAEKIVRKSTIHIADSKCSVEIVRDLSIYNIVQPKDSKIKSPVEPEKIAHRLIRSRDNKTHRMEIVKDVSIYNTAGTTYNLIEPKEYNNKKIEIIKDQNMYRLESVKGLHNTENSENIDSEYVTHIQRKREKTPDKIAEDKRKRESSTGRTMEQLKQNYIANGEEKSIPKEKDGSSTVKNESPENVPDIKDKKIQNILTEINAQKLIETSKLKEGVPVHITDTKKETSPQRKDKQESHLETTNLKDKEKRASSREKTIQNLKTPEDIANIEKLVPKYKDKREPHIEATNERYKSKDMSATNTDKDKEKRESSLERNIYKLNLKNISPQNITDKKELIIPKYIDKRESQTEETNERYKSRVLSSENTAAIVRHIIAKDKEKRESSLDRNIHKLNLKNISPENMAEGTELINPKHKPEARTEGTKERYISKDKSPDNIAQTDTHIIPKDKDKRDLSVDKNIQKLNLKNIPSENITDKNELIIPRHKEQREIQTEGNNQKIKPRDLSPEIIIERDKHIFPKEKVNRETSLERTIQKLKPKDEKPENNTDENNKTISKYKETRESQTKGMNKNLKQEHIFSGNNTEEPIIPKGREKREASSDRTIEKLISNDGPMEYIVEQNKIIPEHKEKRKPQKEEKIKTEYKYPEKIVDIEIEIIPKDKEKRERSPEKSIQKLPKDVEVEKQIIPNVKEISTNRTFEKLPKDESPFNISEIEKEIITEKKEKRESSTDRTNQKLKPKNESPLNITDIKNESIPQDIHKRDPTQTTIQKLKPKEDDIDKLLNSMETIIKDLNLTKIENPTVDLISPKDYFTDKRIEVQEPLCINKTYKDLIIEKEILNDRYLIPPVEVVQEQEKERLHSQISEMEALRAKLLSQLVEKRSSSSDSGLELRKMHKKFFTLQKENKTLEKRIVYLMQHNFEKIDDLKDNLRYLTKQETDIVYNYKELKSRLPDIEKLQSENSRIINRILFAPIKLETAESKAKHNQLQILAHKVLTLESELEKLNREQTELGDRLKHKKRMHAIEKSENETELRKLQATSRFVEDIKNELIKKFESTKERVKESSIGEIKNIEKLEKNVQQLAQRFKKLCDDKKELEKINLTLKEKIAMKKAVDTKEETVVAP